MVRGGMVKERLNGGQLFELTEGRNKCSQNNVK